MLIFCGGHKRPAVVSRQCFGLGPDPAANWTELAPLPRHLYNAAVAGEAGGQTVTLLGGTDGAPVTSVYTYRAGQGDWTEEPGLPSGLTSACAVKHTDKIYITGGQVDCDSCDSIATLVFCPRESRTGRRV